MKGGIKHKVLTVLYLLLSANASGQSISCADVNFNHTDTIPLHCVYTDTCVNLNAFLPDIRQTVNAANAYLVDTVPFSNHYPFQITGATAVLVNQDDAYSGIINLPFTFCYYGGQYNQVVIGANGTLSFHAAYANQSSGFEMCSNGTWYPGPASPGLPNNFSSTQWGWDSYPRNAIFACFQDIDPTLPATNKGIEWKLEGTAPCRKLVVNWRNIPQFSCTGNTTTFQCVLYENTNVIDIYIQEKPACTSWNCGYALVGIQNNGRNLAVAAPGRNGTVWTTTTANSEGWRFIPNGPSLLEQVVLLNAANQAVDTATTTVAQPGVLSASFTGACTGGTYGNTTKYYAKARYTSCSNPATGFTAIDSLVLWRTPVTGPPATTSISYCQGQATAPLTAGGSNLLWYTQPAGGTGSSTAPVPSAAIPGTFTWYVSQTLNNCESLRSALTVTVNPYIYATQNINICPGQSYTFNGQTYTSAQTGLKDTFTTSGCDSIVTLNINVIPYVTNTINATICQGQSFTYNNVTYLSAGTSTHTFTTAGGCDSIVTLNLNMIPFVTGNIIQTICQGQSYTLNGNTYTSSTSFVLDTFQTATNCDSIVTFTLMVLPYIYGTINATICQNQVYTYNGGIYNASFNGNVDTVQTPAGCDSIIVLNLTVIPFLTGIIDTAICQGKSFLFNNITYTATVSGVTDTFTTASGCDSIVTLNLTVTPYPSYIIDTMICAGQSYVFNGISYNAAVTGAKDTFLTAGGCDSMVTLNLTVIPYLTGTLNVSICQGQSYLFNNISYTNAVSNITDTLITAAGCDSIVTLNLTVLPYLTGTTNDTICSGQSYTFNGNTYTSAVSGLVDTFQNAAGCDSIVTLNLAVKPFIVDTVNAFICQGKTYVFNGNSYTNSISGISDTFQTLSGCDSIVILNLTVNPTVNLTEQATICYAQLPYTWRGMQVYAGGPVAATDTIPALKGCDSIITLDLNVIPQPTIIPVDTAACESVAYKGNLYYQDTTLYEKLTFTNSICDSIIFQINIEVNHHLSDTLYADICIGETYNHNNGETYTHTGYYADTYQSWKGCDSVSVLALRVHALPDITIYYEPNKFCIFDTVSVEGKGAIDYIWAYNAVTNQPGTTALIPLHHYSNTIKLIGKDEFDCVDSSIIEIPTFPCCEIEMPNAFSPNADGLNDLFVPATKGNPLEYAFVIYNRYGQQVFRTTNIDKGWDGTFNGNPAETGVYYYWLSSDCATGENTKLKGDLTLIR